jgi:small subunit ribosomal protein S13
MPRIAGVDIPAQKKLEVALTYIHGIGDHVARKILKEAAIELGVKARDLNEVQLTELNNIIEKSYVVEGTLRRRVAQDIQRLKEINSYRGLRHRKGLPARGQRTRTNARTRKGPRKTVAGKKSIKEMAG